MKARRRWLLRALDLGWRFCRPLLFCLSAQRAHSLAIWLLGRLDGSHTALRVARALRPATSNRERCQVGGARLSGRLILAAGLVKGRGFEDEEAALRAVRQGENIMPGWRVMPALAGAIEFGSFTRHPRLGNPGTTLWRNANTKSTQNRVGLRNPGAKAAATFLGARIDQLPDEYGINIAVSPGVDEPTQQEREVVESLRFFLDAGVFPRWFTLNISCPNTEDDPRGLQLEHGTRQLCAAFIGELRARKLDIPLWVKVSPGLDAAQYDLLMRIFADEGVSAVVATNTLAAPSPDDPSVAAGVGGGTLRDSALEAVEQLRMAKERYGCAVDIIGCGGVMDGESLRQFHQRGAAASQYWSALVYRGPCAAAIIESELGAYERSYEAVHREVLA